MVGERWPPSNQMTKREIAPADGTPRNEGIDLLRGLSILLVVLHHVGLRIPLKSGVLSTPVTRRVLLDLNYNGYEAVFVFFVISGFLITTNTLKRWGRLGAIDVRAFYARRFARIVPCLVALVAVLSVLHLAAAKDYRIEHATQSLPAAIASAFGLYLNWYEGRTGYLPGGWDVLWSLSIEEVFYAGFPIVCLLSRRGREWALVPALALLAASLPVTRAALEGNEIWQEKAYLPGMAAIAAGVLGALIAARVPSPAGWVRAVVGSAGGVGVAAVLLVEGVVWPVLGNGTILLLTTSTAGLVVALHWRASRRPGAHRASLPGTRWLCTLGRLSYEIYLTHMFVVLAVVRAFRASGGDLRFGFVWYVPAVALSWALGAVVERALSGPSEREIKRRLLREGEATVAVRERAAARAES